MLMYKTHLEAFVSFIVFIWDKILLYKPWLPWACYVAKACFELLTSFLRLPSDRIKAMS